MLRLVLLLSIAFALARADLAGAVGWTAYGTAQLDATVERWLGRGGNRRAPAISVAVGVNGRLVFARGYGEARPGLPATEHTVYHIGSLSKQFTAAAVLLLMDRGAKAPRSQAPMTLASSQQDFFDHVELWDGDGHPPITLRGLLTMTSGLPSLIKRPPSFADPWGTITSAQMLAALRALPLSGPADAFDYNNSGYFLLAQIVEAVSAGSFSDFVKSEIITTLDLPDTSFIGDRASYSPMRAAVPSWGNTPAYRRRPAYVEADWLKGAADMASSAVDLFAWDKSLMEDKVLSRTSRSVMFSDAARVGPSTYYGMGWFIEHAPGWDRFSHSGHVPGFTSSNTIVRSPRDGTWISVSLLTNADSVHGLNELTSEIVRNVMHRTLAASQPR